MQTAAVANRQSAWRLAPWCRRREKVKAMNDLQRARWLTLAFFSIILGSFLTGLALWQMLKHFEEPKDQVSQGASQSEYYSDCKHPTNTAGTE